MASEISETPILLPPTEFMPIPSEPLHSNSYMTKLFPVTDELCIFMNIPVGTKVSVKNAVEYVMDYIKTNRLSPPADRTKITLDYNLSALFNIRNIQKLPYDEISISYFDVHEHIYFHFIDK